MNTHIQILKSKIQDKYVIGLLVTIFIISFFLGMEYKAYQFRSVMKDAFSGIQDAFKGSNITPTKREEQKSKIVVNKWGSHTYENGIKLSLDSSSNLWKEATTFGTLKSTATNTFYQVIMIGENTGKAPTHQSLSNIELVLKDGTIYKSSETVQMQWKRDGFGWCIECNMNPNDKAIQGILFDISVPSIEWAKINIGDASFDL